MPRRPVLFPAANAALVALPFAKGSGVEARGSYNPENNAATSIVEGSRTGNIGGAESWHINPVELGGEAPVRKTVSSAAKVTGMRAKAFMTILRSNETGSPIIQSQVPLLSACYCCGLPTRRGGRIP